MSAVFEGPSVTRRQVLIAGAGAAGSFVIGLPALAWEDEGERQIGFFIQILRTSESTTLSAVIGIMDRILVRDFGHTQSLLPYAKTGDVHHNKHRGKALVFLTNHVASGAVIIHNTRRITMDSHFVFD